jgi:hypothetical protein
MAFKISRRLWVLGRPCPLGAGTWGSMYFHSASDRTVDILGRLVLTVSSLAAGYLQQLACGAYSRTSEKQ